MYTIEPRSLKEFVDDSEIKLPRFQRKSTWKIKQNFELALSVFKNYPLGATICFKEIDINKETTKWLLDGRQRRNALKSMYQNPEKLYEWGKNYLKIKNTDTSGDIRDKFWNAVDEYTEKDVTENNEDNLNDEDEEVISETNYQVNLSGKGTEKLDVLLDLILVGFENAKRGAVSGITCCYDLKQYFENEKNILKQLYSEDKKTIDCSKLKLFLKTYKNNNLKNYEEYEVFETYMDDMFTFKDQAQIKFKQAISHSWTTVQLKVIKIFDCIDSIMADRKLAVIETSNISPADEQKIFNLINNSGTQLTASEILSAKPRWNVQVEGIKKEILSAIEKLYDNDLEITSKGTVRWDIPASLCIYLKEMGLDRFFTLKETDISKKITLGFKLLSGFYSGGVKKEDINNLSGLKTNNFDWQNCNDRIDEIKAFFKLFKDNKYIRCLYSWGKSLSDILGDGPTLNYLFILFRNWKNLDCPSGGTKEKNTFDKNCFILLDKMFYEYITNQWKGSSDSTIARNISEFEKTDGKSLIPHIEKTAWESLLKDVFENNTINKKTISKGLCNPLIFYYNILKDIRGEAENKGDGSWENAGEVDHIIPQASWESSAINEKESIMNNVFNLALLPKKINDSKNNKHLLAIKTNSTLAETISRFEEIKIDDFEKFSKIEYYTDLRSLRSELYYDAFGHKRDSILLNSF